MTGIVDLPSGGRAHLLASLRLVIPEDDFRVVVERFELKPIGN